MQVKDLMLGMVGFVMAYAAYDQYVDSGIAKIQKNKQLENKNRVLKARVSAAKTA